jgi:hypothetical protein
MANGGRLFNSRNEKRESELMNASEMSAAAFRDEIWPDELNYIGCQREYHQRRPHSKLGCQNPAWWERFHHQRSH